MTALTLVTGGTGKTGAALLRRLRQAGHQAHSGSRTPSAPGEVWFDWFAPASHTAALEGVDRVYLVAPIGSSTPLDVMGPFIEQALSRGVRRFVLLSSSLIEENGPAMGAVHGFLRRHAPEWAVLRPSWFMENFSQGPHRMSILEENAVYSATDDGLVPFVAVDDIAEVAYHALSGDQALNADLIVTGPAALTYGQVAQAIAAARGEAVRHVRLSEGQLAARFEGTGIPAEFAAMLAGLDRAIAHGAEGKPTGVVTALTGRAPLTFEAFALRHADVWR
jgi:uncharacterized protein YbjT (DUF2867 family)